MKRIAQRILSGATCAVLVLTAATALVPAEMHGKERRDADLVSILNRIPMKRPSGDVKHKLQQFYKLFRVTQSDQQIFSFPATPQAQPAKLSAEEVRRLNDERTRYEYELSDLERRRELKLTEQNYLREDYAVGRIEVTEYREEASKLNAEMNEIDEEIMAARREIENIDRRLVVQNPDTGNRASVTAPYRDKQ